MACTTVSDRWRTTMMSLNHTNRWNVDLNRFRIAIEIISGEREQKKGSGDDGQKWQIHGINCAKVTLCHNHIYHTRELRIIEILKRFLSWSHRIFGTSRVRVLVSIQSPANVECNSSETYCFSKQFIETHWLLLNAKTEKNIQILILYRRDQEVISIELTYYHHTRNKLHSVPCE